jgi:hypothetical protein
MGARTTREASRPWRINIEGRSNGERLETDVGLSFCPCAFDSGELRQALPRQFVCTRPDFGLIWPDSGHEAVPSSRREVEPLVAPLDWDQEMELIAILGMSLFVRPSGSSMRKQGCAGHDGKSNDIWAGLPAILKLETTGGVQSASNSCSLFSSADARVCTFGNLVVPGGTVTESRQCKVSSDAACRITAACGRLAASKTTLCRRNSHQWEGSP